MLKDFSYRSLVEQASKTRALVSSYYGMAPKFSYFDGHSTGGHQGWKMVQALEIDVTVQAGLAPGAPLCRVWRTDG